MPNLSAQSVGRYHIIEPLGEGGMATVYKAYDTHLERDVAIEIIRTGQIVSDYLEKSKSGLIRIQTDGEVYASQYRADHRLRGV